MVLGPSFALLARREALAWPPGTAVCPPGIGAPTLCVLPRPEWRTPVVWTISGAAVGLLVALIVTAVIRWRRPVVWATACVVLGSVAGLYLGAGNQSLRLQVWTAAGAVGGLLVGLLVVTLWLGERWARAEPASRSGPHYSPEV